MLNFDAVHIIIIPTFRQCYLLRGTVLLMSEDRVKMLKVVGFNLGVFETYKTKLVLDQKSCARSFRGKEILGKMLFAREYQGSRFWNSQTGESRSRAF